jgi:pyruvate,water dikinase
MGRLRAALVPIADDVVAAADAALLAVPAVGELTDRQLVAGLERFREALRSLHGYEMLVGLVLHPGEARLTASSVALRVLAAGRAEGIADADLPARYPVVVALTAPHVGPDIELPRRLSLPEWTPGDEDPAGVVREALRLRVRWVQEAGARYAWELGERLAAAGALADPGEVLDLELEALEMTVRGLAVPVPGASPRPPRRDEPLPARFRLSDRGIPIPVLDRHPHQGTGAGGGRGRGPVHVGTGGDGREVPDGVVLVVPTLDARLAPALGRINGLVSETGSVLAHLSILARESGVPVVVGLEGATGRFPEGTEVSVDGTTGAVTTTTGGAP